MSRSRVRWALWVVAPWWLGVGVVMSFTADAGQDTSFGASLTALSSRAASEPVDLIPLATSRARPLFGFRAVPGGAVQEASLSIGDGAALTLAIDEIEPRMVMKPRARALPTPERAHRSDPNVNLRPTFDARLRQNGGVDALRSSQILLSSESYLAFDGFEPEPAAVPDNVAGLEAVDEDDVAAAASPVAGSSLTRSGSTPALRSAAPVTPRVEDGATPTVPRAVALASATPAPPDQIPVEVVASGTVPQPGAPGRGAAGATIVFRDGERPNYAALLDQNRAVAEERCLAEAVYFESRSEPEAGQAAVAQVVLNRVRSGLYPTSICGVVYQNRHRRNACQFSFACEGKALRVSEPEAWETAQRVASAVLEGKTYVADVGGSTHYHANYVRPRWARALKQMDVIGHHIFYKLRAGQT